MRIILHVGFRKTGSSALQHVFAKHKSFLDSVGVYYPYFRGDFDAAASGEVSSGNAHELVKYLVPDRRRKEFSLEEFERSFPQRYLSPEHNVLLLSSEMLHSAQPETLARFKKVLLDGHDVTVVAFVRNLYEHAISTWMQKIKGNDCDEDFETFCLTYRNGQFLALRDYAAAFGRERIRLIHYESHASDLVGAFFAAVDIEAPALGASVANVNRSLSASEVKVLTECNRIHRNQYKLSRTISDALLQGRPNVQKFTPIKPGIIELFRQRYGSQVEWINDRFFDGRPVLRVHGDLNGSAQAEGEEEGVVWRDVVAVLVKRIAELETRRRNKGKKQTASL